MQPPIALEHNLPIVVEIPSDALVQPPFALEHILPFNSAIAVPTPAPTPCPIPSPSPCPPFTQPPSPGALPSPLNAFDPPHSPLVASEPPHLLLVSSEPQLGHDLPPSPGALPAGHNPPSPPGALPHPHPSLPTFTGGPSLRLHARASTRHHLSPRPCRRRWGSGSRSTLVPPICERPDPHHLLAHSRSHPHCRGGKICSHRPPPHVVAYRLPRERL